MEIKQTEQAKNENVTSTVRDRIVAFHDKHLSVKPIDRHIVQLFEALALEISSQKGKAWVERMRAKIGNFAKNAEVVAAVGDMTVGVIGAGVALEGATRAMIGGVKAPEKASHFSAKQQTYKNENDLATVQKPAIRAVKGAVTSGIFLGVRPITRLADAAVVYGMPLAKRVTRWVDSMLLRREYKRIPQVYFGSAKA